MTQRTQDHRPLGEYAPDGYLPPQPEQQQDAPPTQQKDPDRLQIVAIGAIGLLAAFVVGGVGVAISNATSSTTVHTPEYATSTPTTRTTTTSSSSSGSYTSGTDSLGLSYMKLAWYAADESSRSSVRSNWSRLKGTSMESSAIAAAVSAFSDSSMMVTPSDARAFLDWTLVN